MEEEHYLELTINEIAASIKRVERTVYRMIERSQLRAEQIGPNRYRVAESDLVKFMPTQIVDIYLQRLAQLQQELTDAHNSITELRNRIESLEQRYVTPRTTIEPIDEPQPVNLHEPNIGYEKRISTRKSANPPLPDGWVTCTEFAVRHEMAPTTMNAAIKKRLPRNEGTWSVPGVAGPVRYAFDPEQQRACVEVYREKMTPCEVPGCPCHKGKDAPGKI